MGKVVPTIDLLNTPILYRKDGYDSRHYASKDDEGNTINVMASVTTITNVMPMDPQLAIWSRGFGSHEAYKKALRTMAYYGTLCHIVFGDLCLGIPFDMSDVNIEKYFNLNKMKKEEGGLPEYSDVSLPAEIQGKKYTKHKFRKDVIAMYQFVQDWVLRDNVRVVGIELPLADSDSGYAGCLDLVLEVDKGKLINIGTEEEKWEADLYWVIFDLKSGSGHWLSHEVQLNAYQRLFRKCLKLDTVYYERVMMCNVNLKDWKDKTYKDYLNGTSKTTPYTITKVKENNLWEHTLVTYKRSEYNRDMTPEQWNDEINYDTTIDEVIKQIKGEENAEADNSKSVS